LDSPIFPAADSLAEPGARAGRTPHAVRDAGG
jgi:hypothetical protein